jgi:dienelactone hydrolase
MATRPEVDPKRIATMGISGGGLTSLFTAAADTRVRAAVVSGYLNTFAGSVLAVDHCPDNYAPGLLKLAEMPDIAGLVAPRGLFCESGTKDDIFPLPHFEKAAERVKAIYEERGAGQSFGFETFEGDHRFHGKGAFAFLKAVL